MTAEEEGKKTEREREEEDEGEEEGIPRPYSIVTRRLAFRPSHKTPPEHLITYRVLTICLFRFCNGHLLPPPPMPPRIRNCYIYLEDLYPS